MGIRLYQGGTFINFEKSPGGTIISGGTFIRESRVGALKQGYFQIRFDLLTCEELAILTWRQK